MDVRRHGALLVLVLAGRLAFAVPAAFGATASAARSEVTLAAKPGKAPKAAVDNRANQMNPNNPRQTKAKKVAQSGRAVLNNQANHANQMNPNHPAFQQSRRLLPLEGEQRQRFAQKKKQQNTNEGHWARRAQLKTANDKLPTHAFDSFLRELRKVVPSAQVRKTGSRNKGTAIGGSDWDYHITSEPMSTQQRDQILTHCQASGIKVTCSKAFTMESQGASIDFFPPNAEWHDKVSVQKPGSVKFDHGAKNAIKSLKDTVPGEVSHALEQLLLEIQRDKGWSDKNDPSGQKRFQEAQRRLCNRGC